jgi:hypothetical protein
MLTDALMRTLLIEVNYVFPAILEENMIQAFSAQTAVDDSPTQSALNFS